MNQHVYQALGHALIEHVLAKNESMTMCRIRAYSVDTDSDETLSEDTWYSEHDLPLVRIIPCGICMPGHADDFYVELDDLISAGGIAKLIGFSSPAISNWQRRDPTFPKPLRELGQRGQGGLWSKREVLAWFQRRFENVMKEIKGI